MLDDIMVRNNPWKLSRNKYEKMYEVFHEVITQRDKTVFNEVIFDLLTSAERIMLTKRIVIIYLLMKQIEITLISEILHVSLTTIYRQKIMMERSHGIVPILQKKITKEKISMTIEELLNDIFGPGTYGINWDSAWRRKLDLARRKEQGI